MIRLLVILDTWLMMVAGTLFLWLGLTGLRAGTFAVGDIAITLLGGIAGICSVGLLCRWRSPLTQPALVTFRLLIVGCLAYFAWFQDRPWLALDDSALVRGSFRQEFFLQRLEQVGVFLVAVVPIVVLGIWHARVLPRMQAVPVNVQPRITPLVVLVGTSVAAGIGARLVGIPSLGPIFWTVSVLVVVFLLFELARRISNAEFSAFVAFAVFTVAMPIVLLWP
ncbi:hypothetical protein [Bryobacter aggregatus]|uniref:hypothetical protein n=1 Tax=Bryobacter aggregatus TaxID=360054 RepID=UPI0004E1F1F8|nr:hypothetical protein [Bryobacter aggregatus]